MFKRLLADYREFCYFDNYENYGRRKRMFQFIRFVYCCVRCFFHEHVTQFVCHRYGHDWIDESYGGPDSGCMAGECKRCGESFHTTLY